ncbi:MAG: MazG nucleotide pyrophosphohydrolase domain-containing protein [Planctomycetota bacterium]|jgi:NTP pyrophosphatase (non-canonical NTP hydrolase)
MEVKEFQNQIEAIFGEKDRKRGVESTWLWFTEEVGELARALNGRTSRENLRDEFADVFAWLATMASIANVDLEEVSEARYGQGCPRCKAMPCKCDEIKQRPRAYRC